MKKFVNIIAPFAVLVISITVFSCGHKNKPAQVSNNIPTGTEMADTFFYNYGDASTSPKYHRSYMIKVIPGMIYFEIDVYGDIKGKDSLILGRTAYDSFATAISNLHIKEIEETPTEGCTGGTTDALELFASSNHVVKGHVYHCGGQDYKNLEGDVASAASLFKSLIPDLQQRIDATRKND